MICQPGRHALSSDCQATARPWSILDQSAPM
jgi:hypothetical protein